jgi:hypothetical protein
MRYFERRSMKRDEIWNPKNGNRINVFWRAALSLAYLYLNFAAYQLIGIEGVAIMSGFFIVAQFSPLIVRTFGKHRKHRFVQTPKILAESEIENQIDRAAPLRSVNQTEQ